MFVCEGVGREQGKSQNSVTYYLNDPFALAGFADVYFVFVVDKVVADTAVATAVYFVAVGVVLMQMLLFVAFSDVDSIVASGIVLVVVAPE